MEILKGGIGSTTLYVKYKRIKAAKKEGQKWIALPLSRLLTEIFIVNPLNPYLGVEMLPGCPFKLTSNRDIYGQSVEAILPAQAQITAIV